MSLGSRFYMEPLRSLAFGSIGAAYVSVGTSLSAAARSFLVQNLTDVTLIFSWGEDIDNFVLPTNTQFVYDSSSNKTHTEENLLAERTALFVKQDLAAPTSGSVYFSVFGSEGSGT